jgi:hypothetical protein
MSDPTDPLDPDDPSDEPVTDAADEAPEPAGADSSEPASASKGRSQGSKGRSDKALIRRTIAKTIEVNTLSADAANLLADALGCDGDVASLTLAVMTTGRAQLAPISALLEMASMDPLEAGVVAAGMDRPDLRRVWSVLAAMGRVPATMPGADAKAALALAKVVVDLKPDDLAELEVLTDVAKSRR